MVSLMDVIALYPTDSFIYFFSVCIFVFSYIMNEKKIDSIWLLEFDF